MADCFSQLIVREVLSSGDEGISDLTNIYLLKVFVPRLNRGYEIKVVDVFHFRLIGSSLKLYFSVVYLTGKLTNPLLDRTSKQCASA